MSYPSDKRKKSISFHADTWERISRRKNLSGFINKLIREHFEGDNDNSELEQLRQKNQEQEKIIQAYLKGWQSENFYDLRVGLAVSKQLGNEKGVTPWQKRTSE